MFCLTVLAVLHCITLLLYPRYICWQLWIINLKPRPGCVALCFAARRTRMRPKSSGRLPAVRTWASRSMSMSCRCRFAWRAASSRTLPILCYTGRGVIRLNQERSYNLFVVLQLSRDCAFPPCIIHSNAASSSKEENTARQSGATKEIIDTTTTNNRQYCMCLSYWRSIWKEASAQRKVQ